MSVFIYPLFKREWPGDAHVICILCLNNSDFPVYGQSFSFRHFVLSLFFIQMNISLQDKRVLVCGSTKGIGWAIARQMAISGASVILMARDENALRRSLSELPGSGHDFVIADFSHPTQVVPSARQAIARNGNIHILVNNTGGPPGGFLMEAEPDAFRQTFNQHLVANHLLMQTLLPGMKAEAYGRIINIISTSVKQPLKGLGVSNTIRAAVANWAKTLSVELAPFGITVNNVLPGATDTDRLRTLMEVKAQKTGLSVEEINQEMLSEIPAGRFADPSEIASAAVFLASPAASYINGINLPVDGGRTSCL